MSFTCPPSELILYVLESLAFSGLHGLSLTEMWQLVSKRLNLDDLDNFQKQIIWQWLFFHSDDDNVLQLYVVKDGTPLTIAPNYETFLSSHGDEDSIRVMPTNDTQWKYLTGLEVSKKMKFQLGEKPFQLLIEIARYGADGILSADLCRATGQDPRSLPVRFKKLEELGFIKKKAIYDAKSRQHTNLCIHSKFAESNIQSPSQDFIASRNAYKFRQYIVQSVKDAPNQLRGFKDLKKELKMDNSKSSHKFFGSMVEYLHSNGYVERLMVNEPESERLVYCIKYIKDLPRDLYDVSDYIDIEQDDSNKSETNGEDEVVTDKVALINDFFPFSVQMYQQILSTGTSGAAAKEIIRNITGNSAYRPFARLLDIMSSYVVDDNHNLVPIKNYPDVYDENSIVRTYDFDGKFKFYRYFIRSQVSAQSVKDHKSKRPKSAVSPQSLVSLSTKLFTPLGKSPKGSFITIRKRANNVSEGKISKKPKLMARTTLRARSQISPVIDTDNVTDQDTTLNSEVAVKSENEVISINEVESIKPDIVSDAPKKRRSEKKPIIKVSLKGKRRRLQLIEIIKELGGVTYTTAKLRRSLDERLGVSTTTDIKTLARDISILISTGELEAETIEFERSGQLVKRRLLILTDEKLKPSKEAIEQAKEECLADNGVRNKARDRRIIEGEVTLYETSRPIAKKTKPRLESLERGPGAAASTKKERASSAKSKRQVKATLESDNVGNDSELMDLNNDVDVLPELVSKKHKRKIKPAKIKKEPSKLTRRFRQTIKFDKSDATTLFRAVVISKSFKRGGIDFEQIALLFDDADEKVIKQKWTMVRKKVGGLQAVTKGKEAFEHIVIKGIEEGVVTTEDLEDIKFSFFLQLWKETDNSVLEAFDKTPLHSSVQENLSMYSRNEVSETVGDLFEQLEDNSMRQKESILARKTFYNVELPEITSKDHDEVRTVLKAIISTPEEKYTAAQVKQILAQYDDEETKQASIALIRDREMLYYGTEDVATRFVLTERVQNSLNVKLKPKFFTQAAGFRAHIQSIFEANKGLILSQGIANGEVAALLQLLSTRKSTICHIDKSQLPDGYESRLVDKEKLACDIVAFNDEPIKDDNEKKVPIPIGKPCSHIWLDLNGNINEQLWTKIIVAILYFISFRPGIPPYLIYNKLLTVLGYRDFFAVTNWLISSNYITQGDYDGYWVTDKWCTVLGF